MHAMRPTTDSICRLTVAEDLKPVQNFSRLSVSYLHDAFALDTDDTHVADFQNLRGVVHVTRR